MTEAVPVWLDADDEITTAAARVRGAAGSRVALVLPAGSVLATSRINFLLLAREAASVGKLLEIVSPDAGARALAAAAGLEARASLAAREAAPPAPAPAAVPPAPAPRSAAPVGPPQEADPVPIVGPRRPPMSGRSAAMIAGLVLLGVAVVGGVGFLALPSATITIIPATASVGPLELTVTAQPGITSPDPVAMVIPAVVASYDVSVTKTFTTAGVKVTETPAVGSVTFVNCDSSAAALVPKGARVETATGVEFTTVAAISIPRAVFFPVPTCKSGDVGVEASLPGETGNVAAGIIDVIPWAIDPTILKVTNAAATAGGTHVETPQVSQEDVDTAIAGLRGELDAASHDRLAEITRAAGDTTVFPETGRLGEATPSVDPATLVGLEAATFDLGLAARGTVLEADSGPVTLLAQARLQARVPDGWRLDEASVAIRVGVATVIGDTVSFPVAASATRTRIVDGPALLERVRGLDLPAARVILDDYGEVRIEVWPDWVTTIPTNGRARLDVATPVPATSPGPAGSGAP